MNIRVVEPPAGRSDIHALPPGRVQAAKRGFSTRRLRPELVYGYRAGRYRPRPGDLVLARVGTVGQHKRIERPDGRRAHLFAGDEIIVAYGNRYAPDQFEARVPANLKECDLVAAGGIAAQVYSSHRNMAPATRIQPVGVLVDARGQVLNLDRFAAPRKPEAETLPPVIAVLGTSMNSGKTTALSRLVLGLSRAGLKAAACKVTGTGAGGDYWMMRDAGAAHVADFTDMGHASTYGLTPHELEQILLGLVADAAGTAPDVILLEIADGLMQPETRALIDSPLLHGLVQGTVFAASEAMGAVAGCSLLQQRRLPVIAVTGAFTASPLAVQEAMLALEQPVLLKTELSDPEVARGLLTTQAETDPMREATRTV